MKRDWTQIITRIGKYLLAVYAVVSVVYTAHYFYSSYDRQHHGIQPRAREAFDQEPIIGMTESQLNEHAVVWSNGPGAIQSLPENYVMTKVFSGALGPSNLTPYFYRAKEPFDKEDITMATLVTRNRFPVLSRLASNHKGMIPQRTGGGSLINKGLFFRTYIGCSAYQRRRDQGYRDEGAS